MNKEKDAKPDMKPEIIRTILQEGVDFEVTAPGREWLHRIPYFPRWLLPASRKFIIYPIKLGSLFLISKVILAMGKFPEPEDNTDLFEYGLNSIVQNKDAMIEITAIAIMNCKMNSFSRRFRKWRLTRYLDENLDTRELLRLITLIIAQMDVTDFLASFVSIKRLNLVEAKKAG